MADDSKDARDSRPKDPEVHAVILLGHGSRAVGAANDMERVVEQIKRRLGTAIVESCQMSGLGVHYPEAFRRCLERGATRVTVIPYFLHFGVHLRQDVPEMMRQAAEKFPHVTQILGKHLGFDEALVDIVIKRIEASEDLCDIRELPSRPVERNTEER